MLNLTLKSSLYFAPDMCVRVTGGYLFGIKEGDVIRKYITGTAGWFKVASAAPKLFTQC